MRKDIVKKSIIILFYLFTSKVFAGQIFLDELPIAISRSEFLKKYPTAVLVLKKAEPTRDMYVTPFITSIGLSEKADATTSRTFVGDVSCAAGSGFGPTSIESGRQIIKKLMKRHSKLLLERKVNEGKDTMIYMVDTDAQIKLTLRLKHDEKKPPTYIVTYSVVLNTCPLAVARDHQVIAPQ